MTAQPSHLPSDWERYCVLPLIDALILTGKTDLESCYLIDAHARHGMSEPTLDMWAAYILPLLTNKEEY